MESKGKRNFTVKIPGSTSNLGPGFDTVSAEIRQLAEEVTWVAATLAHEIEHLLIESDLDSDRR